MTVKAFYSPWTLTNLFQPHFLPKLTNSLMTQPLTISSLGVKMIQPSLFGVPPSLPVISFLITSSTTTSLALSASSTPMVLERLYQTGGSLQMSSSRKERSIYFVRSTGEKLLSHNKCLSTITTTSLKWVSTTQVSSPTRTVSAFHPPTPTTKPTTGHVSLHSPCLPQMEQLPPTCTTPPLWLCPKIMRDFGGTIIC